MIADALYQIFVFTNYKQILRKPIWKRTAKQRQTLINLLMRQPILQNFELKEDDYGELADSLTFEEIEENQDIYSYHD